MDSPAPGTFDLLLRGGLIGLMLLTAALLWRDHARSTAGRIGAAFAVGAAAHVLHGLPAFGLPAQWWQAPVIALDAGNGLLFWLFARALFDDEFVLHPAHLGGWAVLAMAGLLDCFALVGTHEKAAILVGAGIDLSTLAFALLAVGQSLATWRADLVERRRRLRGVVVGASAGYTLLLTLAKLAEPRPPGVTGEAETIALAVVVLLIVWPLLRAVGGNLFREPAAEKPRAVATTEHDTAPDAERREQEADTELIAALGRLMTVELAYREEKLSIGALAAQLGVPEYKLRRVINQQLGHRNFNAFLNGYRIADAKRALADPAMADVPVLTIAMDAGFQSLGPFNRAFKADTGMTPTEFRRQPVERQSLASAASA